MQWRDSRNDIDRTEKRDRFGALAGIPTPAHLSLAAATPAHLDCCAQSAIAHTSFILWYIHPADRAQPMPPAANAGTRGGTTRSAASRSGALCGRVKSSTQGREPHLGYDAPIGTEGRQPAWLFTWRTNGSGDRHVTADCSIRHAGRRIGSTAPLTRHHRGRGGDYLH